MGHATNFEVRNADGSIRSRLRRALGRLGGRHQYEAVRQDADGYLNGGVRKDPNFYCHYLTFNGVTHPDHPEQRLHNEWKQHCLRYLGDRSAASLLSVRNDEDTGRSILGCAAHHAKEMFSPL